MVVSISLLVKAFPGRMIEVANCKHPITLCISLSFTVRDLIKSDNLFVYRLIFSCGNLAVISLDESWIPRKTISCAGPIVLLTARGTLSMLHTCSQDSRYFLHSSNDAPRNIKSSRTCIQCFTENLFLKIHSRAVEKHSKIWQLDAHPCARHLS